jgi:hypothetical protein
MENMIDEKYVHDLEERNDELMDKLANAESQILKIKRGQKVTYPVFKLCRVKIKRAVWYIAWDYLSNCDCKESVIPTVTYTVNRPNILSAEKIIGFVYWRQTINYKWALSGMSKFLDLDLNPVYNIEINTKNGDIIYKNR